MAVAARDSAYDAIQGLLRHHSQLTITAQDNGLLLNRKLYRQAADSRALARRMLQRGIRSVSFLAHFDTAELASLIALLDADPDRLREQGGPQHRLHSLGVSGITLAEVDFKEETEADVESEPESHLALLDVEQLVALLADYLLGKREAIDDPTYDAMLQLLGEPMKVARLLMECVSRAAAASLEGGRAAFVAQMLQKLEAVVLARSPEDWEKVKASVRQAIGRLPPALRPKIFATELTDWETRRQETQAEQEVALARLPALLSQLSQALGALRAVPDDVSKHVADAAGARYAPVGTAPQFARSELATLLEGMAAMRLGPVPVRREMAELLDTTSGHASAAKAAVVLVEAADRETELAHYSKLATELENRAKALADSSLSVALTIVEMFWAHVSDNRSDFSWRRMRAEMALEAIGTDRIVQMAAKALTGEVSEHVTPAARLLAKLGPAGIGQLARLLAEGLPAESETAAADALVAVGQEAVGELACALESPHSSARVPVVPVLARIGGERALGALGQGLKCPDKLVRLAVVQCLGTMGSDAAVGIVAQALEDSSPVVRETAIVALGMLRSPKAVEYLSRVALDKSLTAQAVTEKRKAISALAQIGTEEARSVIAAVLRRKVLFRRSAQQQLRECAQQALRTAGSQQQQGPHLRAQGK